MDQLGEPRKQRPEGKATARSTIVGVLAAPVLTGLLLFMWKALASGITRRADNKWLALACIPLVALVGLLFTLEYYHRVWWKSRRSLELVALLTVLGLVLAVMAIQLGKAGARTAAGPNPPKTIRAAPNIATTLGDFTVTVSRPGCGDSDIILTPRDHFQASSGVFCRIDLMVVNTDHISESPQFGYKLRVGKDSYSQPSVQSALGDQVLPGGTSSAALLFEVPPPAQPTSLELLDTRTNTVLVVTFEGGSQTPTSTGPAPVYVSVSIPNTSPTGITSGPSGTLWFTGHATSSIWNVTPGGAPHMVKQLPSHSSPFRIVQGPDGNMWFTEGHPDSTDPAVTALNGVGRLSPDGAQFKQIPLPRGSNPVGITVGPDHNMWVTGYNQEPGQTMEHVYKISLAGDLLGSYPVPNNPNEIVTGPDNNIWITQATGAEIWVLKPDGTPTRRIPVLQNPTAIVVGPDGKTVWITSHDSHSIQSITIDGITSKPFPAGRAPGDLVNGPDGNLWFSDLDGRQIGVMAPDGLGTILKWIPVTGGAQPFALTVDNPSRSVWFTADDEWGPSTADAVGQIAVQPIK